MITSLSSFPRALLLSGVLLGLGACSNGSSVDGELKGRVGGRDTQLTLHMDTSGGPIYDGTLGNDAPNRDIAPGHALIGGVASSSVRGGKCLLDPCPPLVELEFDTPPPILYAGTWKTSTATLVFEDENFYDVAAVRFHGANNRFELTFDEPSFSGSGNVTMVNTGKVQGVSVNQGETLEFKGDFRLEYQCHKQSVYYRHCGNQKNPEYQNPQKRPYTENTCPAELVAPFEGKPVWEGNQVKLGEFTLPCREGNSADASSKNKPLLCYLRREKVSAAGCRWNVHVLTDGAIQQFAIAGFAVGECAQKTCNTYR